MSDGQVADPTEVPSGTHIPSLQELWQVAKFDPNSRQEEAILHLDTPLYLPAGPGSGKTRVLLWRVVNLLVYHGVKPEEVFLATFTEKAALQLREGLRALLSIVTERAGRPYDVSKLYVGTVHSLCQRLLADRRFSAGRERQRPPVLLDELAQYMLIRRRRNWDRLLASARVGSNANHFINAWFGESSNSRHKAIGNCVAFFNRLSEECIEPDQHVHKVRGGLRHLLKMYKAYREILKLDGATALTDFALIQQEALCLLKEFPESAGIFRHVIIDEYQDTNTVQERLFFWLAGGHKNLCVVGDDDQALYRFRGATVENFVEFPSRCRDRLDIDPHKIALGRNYRSPKDIVDFFKDFMSHPACDWSRKGGGFYRVTDKDIHSHLEGHRPAVVATDPGKPEDVANEVAKLVRKIIKQKKVENPNQVAFLFPTLNSRQVGRMRDALQSQGLLVYAPRAGKFLEVEEATAMLGLFFQVFGWPERGEYQGKDYQAYYDWVGSARDASRKLIADDALLERYVQERKSEAKQTAKDYLKLLGVAQRYGWDIKSPYDPDLMRDRLAAATGLSRNAVRALNSAHFERHVRRRLQEKNDPFLLGYAISRASSLDWTVLDLFYQLCGFRHFREMFDLAEQGEDEGPICSLSLVSQYLSRYTEEYPPVITGEWLDGDRFLQVYNNYLYILFRRGEKEYEDAEDPFPKGRIPFITIHQAKGLEFPVVVLASPLKRLRGPQPVEKMVRPLLDRDGEPLKRMDKFDAMRMFYVALSRAKNLLVVAHFTGQGNALDKGLPFRAMLDDEFQRIRDLNVSSLPDPKKMADDLPRTYSYTADFLAYKQCPRQYMVFRRYNFAVSRSQTMFFGSLVHQTIEDLHQLLIHRKGQP